MKPPRNFVCQFVLLLVAVLGTQSHSLAEVIFFDGFGDADLDNNGVALEFNDVDVTLRENGSFEPAAFEGVTVNMLTEVEDASDTGLRWLSSRGFTSGAPFDPKANIKIVDDTQGALPETAFVQALDSGYAMAWESKGRGSSATAFFDREIALGPEEGDQVKVGFDFRTWQSAPNENSFTPPELGSLRFGLYQDTDEQLGTVNPFAGRPDELSGIPSAAVWGQDHGHFRGDSVGEGAGAIGDHGWFVHIDLGDPTSEFGPLPGGPDARIREESNEAQVAGESVRFLEGADGDTVAEPNQDEPDFVAMDSTRPYRLELTLERVVEDEDIFATFQVTSLDTQETWVLSGDQAGADIQSDFWHYFAIRNTGADDFDFLLDNFMLEINGSNASQGVPVDFNGDGNVDTADVDELVRAIVTGDNQGDFDLNGDGSVNQSDLDQWLSDGASFNGLSDSYLKGDANLDGSVDALDLNALGSNWQGTPDGWSGGDFDADGAAMATDLNLLGNNWLQSVGAAAATAPVPEPSGALLGLFGIISLMMLRTRTS